MGPHDGPSIVESRSQSPRRPLLVRSAVAAGSLVLTLLVLEAGFRCFGSAVGVDRENLARYQRFVREGGLAYQPHPYTVFTRRPDPRWTNSLGFPGPEWRVEKDPGTLRILCLGASTTAGGNDAGRIGQYPYLLQEELRRRTGRSIEVLNAGISAWTSAETLVAWFLLLQDFDPDLIVVHHAINDAAPRAEPDFRPDYAHWRRPFVPPRFGPVERALVSASQLFAWFHMSAGRTRTLMQLTTWPTRRDLDALIRDGIPPDTARAFRRNIENLGLSAEARGADVVLFTMPMRPRRLDRPADAPFRKAAEEHNEILRQLAREHGWLLAEGERWAGRDPEEAAPEFLDLVHMSARGNLLKARLLADLLGDRWAPLGSEVPPLAPSVDGH